MQIAFTRKNNEGEIKKSQTKQENPYGLKVFMRYQLLLKLLTRFLEGFVFAFASLGGS